MNVNYVPTQQRTIRAENAMRAYLKALCRELRGNPEDAARVFTEKELAICALVLDRHDHLPTDWTMLYAIEQLGADFVALATQIQREGIDT